MSSIQQLAEEYATAHKKKIDDETKQYLDQYNVSSQAQKDALELSKQQAINTINQNKATVEKDYAKEARQAYINKMLSSQDVKQKLSQAGLNTTGVVGSAYSDIENSYGNNLAALQTSRDESILNLNNEISDTETTFAIKEQELLSEIANAELEIQKYGSERAQEKYEAAMNEYIALKQYEQQKAEFEESKRQWQLEYELALKNAEASAAAARRSSSSSGYVSSPVVSVAAPQQTNYAVNTDYYQGNLNPDANKYGTFSNGYQPKGISGYGALKQTGQKMQLSTVTKDGVKKVVTQNVWKTPDGTLWYWDGRYNKYIKYK